MIQDTWTWQVRIQGGGVLTEAAIGHIGSIPSYMIESLELRHVSGSHGVSIDMTTGCARMPNGTSAIPPQFEEGSRLIPMFFRRKSLAPDMKTVRVEFRAVGFVIHRPGMPPLICAIRVFDDRIDSRFMSDWPESTARHTASTGPLLQGS